MIAFLTQNLRWLAPGFLLTFASAFGQTWFIALFAGEIKAVYGLSDGGWGSLYTLATLVAAGLLFLRGALADTMPLGRLAAGVALAFALAAALMAWTSSPWLLGLAPRTLSDFASYAFYRFECALRSSAILGFLGFPTLGYHLSLAFDNLRYPEVWTFLYALLALILTVELWSAALRRREGWA